ncbi:nucleotide-sugar transporter [Piromyces finnis]|uniref:Nucleotide-sugar transporter n=1 Tax=Piromyces finnis TaxID=1754191 RepID=A0A1Y1V980_9FUNG|nr:nucleotide-sugar transporter [Piromyces finnis]|eukprot:ORX50291.1 nucleotide-sugar transporter [Piromyces finnis]
MNGNIKWISLFILVIQNNITVSVMRHSKTLPDKYLSSTAVVCSEVLKLIVSMIIHICCRKKEITHPEKYSFKIMMNELFGKDSDCKKIMIPAVLYLIQNNIQYFAASKLDVATYQITYKMKLIMTALFSVLLLKRKLYKHQWSSIVLLAAGITMVQFPTGNKTASATNSTEIFDNFLGVFSIFIACLSSGFAGVYFEKILKNSKTTLWARNVQLSLFSVIPGFIIGCLLLDGKTIKEKGFFSGYSYWTVLTIICQAYGGIIVAFVVKYADNILKDFANSISIILSCIVSYFLFEFHITRLFSFGCCLVMFSTYLYSQPGHKKLMKNTYEKAQHSKISEFSK